MKQMSFSKSTFEPLSYRETLKKASQLNHLGVNLVSELLLTDWDRADDVVEACGAIRRTLNRLQFEDGLNDAGAELIRALNRILELAEYTYRLRLDTDSGSSQ